MAYERPTVLVDMDDVLADFDGAIETRIRSDHPALAPLDPTLHYFTTKRTDDQSIIDYIHGVKNAQGFFRDLPVIDGSLEGWEQIKELGYHPRVCTAPLETNIWCVAEKLEWLDAHLGAKVADDAILDEEKWKHPGITLIDDRPDINGIDRASWVHTLFTQPYNRSIDTAFRIDNWSDPDIPTVLARCAQRAARLSMI